MVAGLLSVDFIILLVWQVTDPLQRILETFPLEDPISATDDIKIRPELEHCESEKNSMWLGEYSKFKIWNCLPFTLETAPKVSITYDFNWISLQSQGIVYGYKGLILVFGLFLAYETRSVKLKQINDSRYVGMSIYNVVVLCLITAPVGMVIASQQDASFVFVALAVIFCCFLSMLLVFVPKVRTKAKH